MVEVDHKRIFTWNGNLGGGRDGAGGNWPTPHIKMVLVACRILSNAMMSQFSSGGQGQEEGDSLDNPNKRNMTQQQQSSQQQFAASPSSNFDMNFSILASF